MILRKSCKNNAKVNSRPWLKIRDGVFSASLPGLQGNPESCQTSKTELFAKIVRNEKPFNIFVKTFILDVWQGSENASELASKVTDVSFLKQFEYQR